MKSVRIQSYSGPHFFLHFPAFGLNTERYPNAGKCGKNADQNNSKYGHFLHSVTFHKKKITGQKINQYMYQYPRFFINDWQILQGQYKLCICFFVSEKAKWFVVYNFWGNVLPKLRAIVSKSYFIVYLCLDVGILGFLT